MKPEDIYKMKLHEKKCFDGSSDVMRVASGWIYIYYTSSGEKHVYVPYSTEMMFDKKRFGE